MAGNFGSNGNYDHFRPPNDPLGGVWDLFSDIMNNRPGRGVDHSGPNSFQPFGFPFGGPHAGGHGGPGGPGGPHPPGAWPWAAPDSDHWDHPWQQYGDSHWGRRRGQRHGRRHAPYWYGSANPWSADEDGATAVPDATATGNADPAAERNPEASSDSMMADGTTPATTATAAADNKDVPDPDEVVPDDNDDANMNSGPGHRRRGPCGRRGRSGRGGRGGFGSCGASWWQPRGPPPHHGGGPRHHHPHHRGPPGSFPPGPGAPPPPPPPYPGFDGATPALDFAGMVNGLSNHPFFQNLRPYIEGFQRAQAQNRPRNSGDADEQPQPEAPYTDEDVNDNTNDDPDSFSPPVDVFNTDAAYVLHVALPGAKKEDVGVGWDQEAGILRIAGVVHRPGDEAFQRGLTSAERRVGMFERSIPLPSPGIQQQQQQQQQQNEDGEQAQREDVDALGITARMEDGLLVVTVPKLEREWTEIRKVDIE